MFFGSKSICGGKKKKIQPKFWYPRTHIINISNAISSRSQKSPISGLGQPSFPSVSLAGYLCLQLKWVWTKGFWSEQPPEDVKLVFWVCAYTDWTG